MACTPNTACRLHIHNLCGFLLHTQHFLYTLGNEISQITSQSHIIRSCQFTHALLFFLQVKLQLYGNWEILADNSSDRMHRHSFIGNLQQSVSVVPLQHPSNLGCINWDYTGISMVHNHAHDLDTVFSYSSFVVSIGKWRNNGDNAFSRGKFCNCSKIL